MSGANVTGEGGPMIGENRQLGTDEPVEFEKWPVEVLPFILEEFMEEYTSN